jgi:methyl-accepting chemotaxis protein
MKIKYRLSIMVIGILLVVVAGISILLLTKSSSMTLALAEESSQRLAAEQARYWEGREEGYMRTLQTISSIMGNYHSMPVEERRRRFNNIMEWVLSGEEDMLTIYSIWRHDAMDGMDAEYAGQAGYTSAGQYTAAYSREAGIVELRASIDVEGAMAYLNGPKSRQANIAEPEFRTVNGKQLLYFRMRVPVINSQTNEVVGMVGAMVNIGTIQPLVTETLQNNRALTAMSIYSDTGMILGSYVPERVGKSMAEADAPLYSESMRDAIEAVREGKLFRTRQYAPALGINMEVLLYPFSMGDSGASWSVMVGISEKIILAGVREMIWFTITIAAIVALAVAVAVYMILSRMTQPIVTVALTLKDISEGEGDLTKTVNVNSDDEIGDLAKYFNNTLDKIKLLVITIKHQAAGLFDIGNELAANMTETAAAINEITANIQSIKTRVINQSASITESNATMEQVTGNIVKLNGHVEKQTDQVSRSSAAIEQMIASIQSVAATLEKNSQSVNALAESSEVGRNGLSEVSTDIQEIAKESEGLLEINAVMENIASQTNLLSMNAAIEAAHAGEAGKGFAVVADEIRKLAESSAEQSKIIGGVLKKIKSSIEKISKSTDNVLEKFELIEGGVKTVSQQTTDIRSAMEEQNAGSKQILEVIGSLNGITQQVKNGSSEMLEGSQQVIGESKNLESSSQEITNGMNEMATGAEQINVAVSAINDLSGKNKENIDVLVREVSKFKVD